MPSGNYFKRAFNDTPPINSAAPTIPPKAASVIPPEKLVAFDDAARMLKLSVGELENLVADGKACRIRGGDGIWMMPEGAIRRLEINISTQLAPVSASSSSSEDLVTFEAAASRLGMTTAELEQIVADGKASRIRGKDGMWRMSEYTVKRLEGIE